MKRIKFVGLDVHAETITVAVAEQEGEVRPLGVVEAAWSYRHRPSVGESLRKRQAVVSEEIREIAWKAQHRLHTRYRKLMARGKEKEKVVTAIGRELLVSSGPLG